MTTALLFTGCSIKEEVATVSDDSFKEVCIINNPKVREGFHDSLASAIQEKGYTVKNLPEGSSLTECKVTMTYTASWHWADVMYMSYAKIVVHEDGKEAGHALYDAGDISINMSKYINADKKVHELVDKLVHLKK